MTLRMSDADYAAYMAKHQPLRTKAPAPRQRAPQDAYAAIVLPTAEPPPSVTLDDLPLLPLQAQRQRHSWQRGAKTRFRKSLAKQVAAALGGAWRYRPYRHAYVNVCRHTAKDVDPDNLATSCKELLDVLQVPSSRCPDGLGLLVDDDALHCVLTAKRVPAVRGKGKTSVEIFGV